MEKLKPCPFCGGEAKRIYPLGKKMVKCTCCGCSTSASDPDPERRWNEREGQ